MDRNPYTALVNCPPVVEKLSVGNAKKARKAMEWPSTSMRVRFMRTSVGKRAGAGTDPTAADADDGHHRPPAHLTHGDKHGANRCENRQRRWGYRGCYPLSIPANAD